MSNERLVILYNNISMFCISTIASVWREDMHEYLSAYMICSKMRKVFRELRGTNIVKGKIYEHILAQDRGYRLYFPSNILQRTCKKFLRTVYCLLYGTSSFVCFLVRLYEQTNNSLLL